MKIDSAAVKIDLAKKFQDLTVRNASLIPRDHFEDTCSVNTYLDDIKSQL
jgi:hypothetical protein